MIEAHAIMNIPMDIYLINRGIYRGVSTFDQLSNVFAAQPSGRTNLVAVLDKMAQDHIGTDMGKSLVVHILTDGHPTNTVGTEDMDGFSRWLRNRNCMTKTFFSIILCTDDEEIERAYRPLEYNPGWNRGIPGVDVTEDYRGELRDVRRTRGH